MNESTNVALELVHREHFTVPEWLEREKYIATIRKFDVVRLEAAKALIHIRDKKFYRPYGSLKEFCQRTFNWSERRTQQMIQGAQTVLALPPSIAPLVLNERQARELSKHPEDKRAQIVDDAVRFHSKDGQLTTKAITQSANYEKSYEGPVDNMGYPITNNALLAWERKSEVQELLTHLSKARVIIEKIEDGDPLYRRVNNLRGKHDKLDEFYNELKGALPAYVCYSCDGVTVKTCKLCGGTGVVSEFEWGRKSDPAGHERRLRALSKHEKEQPF